MYFSVVAVGAVGRRLFSFSVNVLFFLFIDNRNVHMLILSIHIGGIHDIINNNFDVWLKRYAMFDLFGIDAHNFYAF